MKRHPTLQPLSREHHIFLTWCRNVRWFAGGNPRSPDAETLLAEWRGTLPYIEAHFEREEAQLFPLVLQWLHKDAVMYIERLRCEHQEWRDRVNAVNGVPSSSAMLPLATLLHDHIRYEERVFFPWLQERLTEEQWGQLRLVNGSDI